jgi:hypothetical protein
MDFLNELCGEIDDEIYVAAVVALTNEQLQYLFISMEKQHRRLWVSKLKPLQ